MTAPEAIEAVLADSRAKLVLSKLVQSFTERRRVRDQIARFTPSYIQLHPEMAQLFSDAIGDDTKRTKQDYHYLVIYYDAELKGPGLKVLSYAKKSVVPQFRGLPPDLALGYDLGHLSQLPFLQQRRVRLHEAVI